MPSARDPRDMPAYSFSEVAHYLRIPLATLRSWLLGQTYRTHTGKARFQPLFEIAGTGIPTAIVAERFRAEESLEQLADDYERTREETEEALHCEFFSDAA